MDLVGQKFGELTVESLVGRDEERRAQLWLCRCDCGGAALRITSALLRARADGSTPSCEQCRKEYTAGLFLDNRERRRAALLKYWAAKGSLWPEHTLDRLAVKIREEVGDELGGWSGRVDPPVEVMPAAEARTVGLRSGEENAYYAASLEEIGAQLENLSPGAPAEVVGVSREAARHVQESALNKLRQIPWIRELLEVDLVPRQVLDGVVLDAAITRAKSEQVPMRSRPLTKTELKRLDEAIERAYAEQAHKAKSARLCVCGHVSGRHFMLDGGCMHYDPQEFKGVRRQRCSCPCFRVKIG